MTTLFSAFASLCRRKFSDHRKSLLFRRQQTGQNRLYMKGSFFTRPFHANACERMPTTTTTPKTKTSHLQHNIEPCKCIFCSEMWKRSWITPVDMMLYHGSTTTSVLVELSGSKSRVLPPAAYFFHERSYALRAACVPPAKNPSPMARVFGVSRKKYAKTPVETHGFHPSFTRLNLSNVGPAYIANWNTVTSGWKCCTDPTSLSAAAFALKGRRRYFYRP